MVIMCRWKLMSTRDKSKTCEEWAYLVHRDIIVYGVIQLSVGGHSQLLAGRGVHYGDSEGDTIPRHSSGRAREVRDRIDSDVGSSSIGNVGGNLLSLLESAMIVYTKY